RAEENKSCGAPSLRATRSLQCRAPRGLPRARTARPLVREEPGPTRMLTQLGSYCQQFDGVVRPLLNDVAQALTAIDAATSDTPGRALQNPLRELRHQLTALCDKVLEQQAYVLIFGPLKSGKSTLMNAIAGTWVSEVSSLPAYPCLVFVSAGQQREYI